MILNAINIINLQFCITANKHRGSIRNKFREASLLTTSGNAYISITFQTISNSLPPPFTLIVKDATIGGNVLCENRCIFYNQSEWWREAVGYCLKWDGDICIATGGKKACFSKFVSDTAPVLICCDAQLEVTDINGVQYHPLENIYTGDGIKPRNLDKLSLLTGILLPLDDDYKCVFMKLRPRESVDYSSLTTAVSINKSGRVKIALGGVDPKPVVTESASINNRDELITYPL